MFALEIMALGVVGDPPSTTGDNVEATDVADDADAGSDNEHAHYYDCARVHARSNAHRFDRFRAHARARDHDYPHVLLREYDDADDEADYSDVDSFRLQVALLIMKCFCICARVASVLS